MNKRKKNKVNKELSALARSNTKAKKKDGAANYGALAADEFRSVMRRIKRNGSGVTPNNDCVPIEEEMMPHERDKEKARTKLNKILFSTGNVEWSTPVDLFDDLNRIFHFDLDACASPTNAKCPRYFTKEQDALRQSWRGTVWMNPPYGRQISHFMKKAYEESLDGATVVCLVPSRTCTRWWHGYAKHGNITLLRNRLKFGGSQDSAPFPSAIVIFYGGVLGDSTRPWCWPDGSERGSQ